MMKSKQWRAFVIFIVLKTTSFLKLFIFFKIKAKIDWTHSKPHACNPSMKLDPAIPLIFLPSTWLHPVLSLTSPFAYNCNADHQGSHVAVVWLLPDQFLDPQGFHHQFQSVPSDCFRLYRNLLEKWWLWALFLPSGQRWLRLRDPAQVGSQNSSHRLLLGAVTMILCGING